MSTEESLRADARQEARIRAHERVCECDTCGGCKKPECELSRRLREYVQVDGKGIKRDRLLCVDCAVDYIEDGWIRA